MAWAASGVLGAIVLAHAALLPGGRWDGDEYFNFAMLRDTGWGFAWRRFYQWSPRPISETVLWLYDGAVTLAGRPLITPFLAALWLVLIGGGLFALRPRGPAAPWRLAVALGVPAMFLLGHVVNEMFYWPMAASPYLLAISGATILTFWLVAGGAETSRDRVACAAALVLACGSSETGVFFVLGFVASLAVLDWRRRLSGRAWYLLPGALALLLLAVMLGGRVAGATGGVTPDMTTFHRLLPSLWGALRDLPGDLAGRDPYRPGPGPLGFLAAWTLLFAGLVFCLRAGFEARVPRRYLLAVAAGAAVSLYVGVAAALFQFGIACCERHHTFRQCLVVLLLVALARLVAQTLPPAGIAARVAGPLLLVAATSIGLTTRLPGLVNDFGLLRADLLARQRNWAALRTDAPLVFRLPARGAVLEGLAWRPGHFSRDGAAPWFVDAMFMYYRRHSGDVVETPAPKR